MKQGGEQLFEQWFGDKSFKAPAPAPKLNLEPGDYCIKCQKVVAKLPVMVSGMPDNERALFYCNNHSCEHFGVLTLVIKRIK